jgi:hypothetical protein
MAWIGLLLIAIGIILSIVLMHSKNNEASDLLEDDSKCRKPPG